MSQSPGGKENSASSRPDESLGLQLAEAEARLLGVLGLTGDVVFEFDEEGCCLAVWTRSDVLLPAPREQLLGRTFTEALGPKIAAQFLDRIPLVLIAGKTTGFEYSLPVAGERRLFSVEGFRLPQRRSVGFLVRDITLHRELELRHERLLRTDPAPSLIENYIVSEMRNPLGYLQSFLYFAERQLTELLQACAKGPVAPALLESTAQEVMEMFSGAREGTRRIDQILVAVSAAIRNRE